jgi:hypothetical protein
MEHLCSTNMTASTPKCGALRVKDNMANDIAILCIVILVLIGCSHQVENTTGQKVNGNSPHEEPVVIENTNTLARMIGKRVRVSGVIIIVDKLGSRLKAKFGEIESDASFEGKVGDSVTIEGILYHFKSFTMATNVSPVLIDTPYHSGETMPERYRIEDTTIVENTLNK